MKKFSENLLIIVFLLLSGPLFAQIEVVYGIVFDEDGNTLPGAHISLKNSNKQTISDIDGKFALFVGDGVNQVIEISFVGCEKQIIPLTDSIVNPILIYLSPYNSNTLDIDDDSIVLDPSNSPGIQKRGLRFAFGADMIFEDFVDYEDVIGRHNTDFMGVNGVAEFEFAFLRNKLDYGVGFGFLRLEDNNNDSISVKFNITQYSIKLGYHLLEAKRFNITPKVILKWKRYRLLNSDINRKIDIEKYIEDRDIDIRFNQIYLTANMDFSYKIQLSRYFKDFWSIGGYCGYILPVNEVPWVYSRGNRLKTDRKIKINNLNLGVYVALNINL